MTISHGNECASPISYALSENRSIMTIDTENLENRSIMIIDTENLDFVGPTKQGK